MAKKTKKASVYDNMDTKQTIDEWRLRADANTRVKAMKNFERIMSSLNNDGHAVSITAIYELLAKLIKTDSIVGFNKGKAKKILGLS